jgi:Flp pilus assembly pilin Flp
MFMLSNAIGTRLALMVRGLSSPALGREEGQTLAEYALILALIAIAVVAAVIFLGGQIGSLFSTIGSDI